MKLELDENLPHDLATAVRGDGQDVHTVIDEQFAGDGVLVLRPAAQDPDSILALNQRLVRNPSA